MCDPTRRTVIRASAALAVIVATTADHKSGLAVHAAPLQQRRGARPTTSAPQPSIHPREEWARGLEPTGPLSRERAEDVRFLLVHHTQTPNGYRRDAVPARLRSIFDYHTGTKVWPDVAYNFFVDAHGGIWEGRQGSLDGPVKGDATGGSQGFAQLCCFIGDHTSSPPTLEAQAAMSSLLAWSAGRYDVDLHAGRTITFVSRGSNRWPRGSRVTTTPIAAHRDMSLTECPGDAAYPPVQTAILTSAQSLAGRAPARGEATAPKGSRKTPQARRSLSDSGNTTGTDAVTEAPSPGAPHRPLRALRAATSLLRAAPPPPHRTPRPRFPRRRLSPRQRSQLRSRRPAGAPTHEPLVSAPDPVSRYLLRRVPAHE